MMLTNTDIFCYITYFIVLFLLISNSKYTTVFFMITALSFMSCFYNNTSAIIICGIILTISYDLIYDTVEGRRRRHRRRRRVRRRKPWWLKPAIRMFGPFAKQTHSKCKKKKPNVRRACWDQRRRDLKRKYKAEIAARAQRQKILQNQRIAWLNEQKKYKNAYARTPPPPKPQEKKQKKEQDKLK